MLKKVILVPFVHRFKLHVLDLQPFVKKGFSLYPGQEGLKILTSWMGRSYQNSVEGNIV